MDDVDSKTDRRPFQAVSVGRCYMQTANDRFGEGATVVVRERERSATIDGQGPFDWLGVEQDVNDESLYRLVPTMQRYRNNLTALSQLYNLYFVAYQGQIFVYVPRSVPKQTLPRQPDLRLVPEPSEVSYWVGGYQDQFTPHTINHVVVGSLGSQEIVVACFDDGDVTAYYTSEIADWISRSLSVSSTIPPTQSRVSDGPRDRPPRPFFHESVGKSAWGLAIHTASRLIAVSSNRCEVTVFALALAAGKAQKQESDVCRGCTNTSCDDIERHVRQRARNWRIVVALGALADNIPNICFVDDDDGSACMVCAVDITGAMWLADIWTPAQPTVRVEPCKSPRLRNSESWPTPSRGWGILALPDTNFLRVKTVEELIGFELKHLGLACKNTVDTGRSILDIPNNPILWQTTVGLPEDFDDVAMGDDDAHFDLQILLETGGSEGSSEAEDDEGAGDDEGASYGDGSDVELDDDSEGTESGTELGQAIIPIPDGQQPPGAAFPGDGSLAVVGPVPALGQTVEGLPAWVIGTTGQAYLGGSGRGSTLGAEGGEQQPWPSPARLDTAYFPHVGKKFEMPREAGKQADFFRGQFEFGEENVGDMSRLEKFARRYHVLRMYEREVELRSLEPEDKRELGVLCPQAMDIGREVSPATKLLFRATSRLSMVAHLPDISLVVLGSPVGRVLLVTPTQLERAEARGCGKLRTGFRVDWMLPRRSDERLYRRTLRPLHGMAVAPVQESGRADASGQPGPRRYRLMLHYRNHDILTYEITREKEGGRLCIL